MWVDVNVNYKQIDMQSEIHIGGSSIDRVKTTKSLKIQMILSISTFKIVFCKLLRNLRKCLCVGRVCLLFRQY